jgi:hypothetical protein
MAYSMRSAKISTAEHRCRPMLPSGGTLHRYGKQSASLGISELSATHPCRLKLHIFTIKWNTFNTHTIGNARQTVLALEGGERAFAAPHILQLDDKRMSACWRSQDYCPGVMFLMEYDLEMIRGFYATNTSQQRDTIVEQGIDAHI